MTSADILYKHKAKLYKNHQMIKSPPKDYYTQSYLLQNEQQKKPI